MTELALIEVVVANAVQVMEVVVESPLQVMEVVVESPLQVIEVLVPGMQGPSGELSGDIELPDLTILFENKLE